MEGKLGAEYHCMKCDFSWTGPASPVECPRCGNKYVVWSNYDEMFGSKKKEKG